MNRSEMKAKRTLAAFWRRYQRDGVPSMNQERFGEWVNGLPLTEFFAMIDAHRPARRIPKKPAPKRAASKPPIPVKSDLLCKSLVAMAAFSLYDNPHAQMLVYKAVRQLQLLDREAVKAGIVLADA